jgi:general secretion pathway protein D
VQADPATNSLIITAPEPLYRQVRAMIDQLDTRRAQVYIESMIVEVRATTRRLRLPVAGPAGQQRRQLRPGRRHQLQRPTAAAATSSLNTGGGGEGRSNLGEGLNLGLLSAISAAPTLAAIARMLQSQTETNIVSTPNLITLDNEEAKIVVGENVPFITGSSPTPARATTNPFQTIERKDVGITLRIKPQIGEGGAVRMRSTRSQSSVKETTRSRRHQQRRPLDQQAIDREHVVVDDGAIIVLGGLIEDRFVDQVSKVPLLGDIPVVGGLFRSESRERKNRTNLMVFLRPVVLRDGDSER